MIHHLVAHAAANHEGYKMELDRILRGLHVFVTGHRFRGHHEMEQAAGYAREAGAASVITALDRPEVDAVLSSDAVLAVPSARDCPYAQADIAIAAALGLPVVRYEPYTPDTAAA